MNADKFFEQYSIEEINKRTRISPISLRYIKNKEFEKIQRVKFLGFVNIIEKEFKIDLSDLIEEYNNATNHKPSGKENTKRETKKPDTPKKKNTLPLLILTLIMFILGAYLLYNNYTGSSQKNKITQTQYLIEETNKSSEKNTSHKSVETNNTNETQKQLTAIPQQKAQKVQTNETVTVTEPVTQKKHRPDTVNIIPKQKVWFRALNLDTNKSVEYLTGKPKTLKGENWYIKFGHGEITINYNDQNITPNTKKIVRILLKNGKYKYLKKPNRYEK